MGITVCMYSLPFGWKVLTLSSGRFAMAASLLPSKLPKLHKGRYRP